MMSEALGKIHFWGSLIFMNLVFLPMFAQGMAGLGRRMYDGGATYAHSAEVIGIPADMISRNISISHAAWALGLAQIPFIINFFWSMKNGRKITSDNPWDATTLEWQTPTPPPHGNFVKAPVAHRGPYEYSVPNHPKDFTPQNQP
jgi:cytochrome c oxidase subunit I